MTAGRRPSPALSRTLWWLVGSIAIAWFVVYNVMRLAGSSPADAAWISLGIGVVVGAAAFAGVIVTSRRLAQAGRVVHRGPLDIPSPSELEREQRDAMRLAGAALAALAVAALVAGVVLGADWLGSDAGDRATTTLILAAWDLLVAVWLGDEALRLRRGEAEGIESVVLGCGLTAVLAGVGLSRDLVEVLQVILIALAGAAGALTSLAIWRLQGARGLPLGAPAVVLVAVLSLILPLTL